MTRKRTARTAVFGVGGLALAYLGIGVGVSFYRYGFMVLDPGSILKWWAPPSRGPVPTPIWVPSGIPGQIT